MRKTSGHTHWWVQVALVVVLALVMRVPQLTGSLWLDEAAQALESTRPWWQQFMIAPDFQPPLFHIVVHLLQYVSHAEWWLRLASVLSGLGSIVFLILTVRAWSSRKAALLAGVLLAVSNIHVFFSSRITTIYVGCILGTASMYAMTVWLQAKTEQLKKKWLVTLVAVNALGALSSYVYIFWCVAQWLTLLIFRHKEWKRITGAYAVSALFFLIWWPWFWEQWTVGQTLREQLPGWEDVVSTPFLKAIPLTLGKFITGVREIDISPFFIVTVGGWWITWAGALVWSWWHALKEKNSRKKQGLLIFTVLCMLAIGLTWIFSLLTPVLAPKRVLFILPVIFVVTLGILKYAKTLGFILIGWFLLWQGYANWSYWTQPKLQRENWRSLVNEVSQSFSPENTAVVFGFDGPFAPWDWYREESWQVYATGTQPLRDFESVESSLEGIQYYEHILVFDYLRDLTDPERKIEYVLTEWGYEEIGAITYPNIGPVRMWVKRQLYAQQEQTKARE